MNGLNVEEIELDGNKSLSADIALRLAGRIAFGSAVIVAKDPERLLASVRKQWVKIAYRIRKERASTLKAATIMKLSNKLARVEAAQFLINMPADETPTSVTIATAEQLLVFAPTCSTMYITTPTDKETLHKITTFMPDGGLVVVYRGAT